MASCSRRVNPPFFEVIDWAVRSLKKHGFLVTCWKHRRHKARLALHRTIFCACSRLEYLQNASSINRPCTGGYMSAIQIVGFGLAVFWTASFVFLGYLLLPRRTELD